MRREYLRIIPLLLFLVVLVLSPAYSQPLTSCRARIKVYRDGSALVVEEFSPPGPAIGEVELELLAEPDPSVPIVVVDEEDLPVRSKLEGLMVKVLAANVSLLKVTYVTQALTRKEGVEWSVRVAGPRTVEILLPAEAVVLYMSHAPGVVDLTEEGLLLSFNVSEGAVELKYMLEVSVTVVKPENATKTAEGTPAGEEAPQSETPREKTAGAQEQRSETARPSEERPTTGPAVCAPYLVAACVVVGAAIAAVVLLRRGGRVELRPEEEELVRLLRERGGEAFQHELAKEMGLPKSTMWRLVMRLREKGVIEVEKRYGMNYLRLVRGRWA